jgi:hypothetical protein
VPFQDICYEIIALENLCPKKSMYREEFGAQVNQGVRVTFLIPLICPDFGKHIGLCTVPSPHLARKARKSNK